MTTRPGGLAATAQGFAAQSLPAKLGLMFGAAALAAVAVATALWMKTPEYRVLFSNLSDKDGGAIVAQLGQMNVPYRVTEGGGTVLVPSPNVHEVRLRLASQGLPRGGGVGFELLEQQRFGITQFQEQVNYQRALEGELARSIQSLAAVQSARVHLAIPKSSAFLRESQKPTASVLVALYATQSLERAQIAGIVHLVAASVPELSPKAVSVLDQNGTLLSQQSDGDLRLDPAQLAYVQSVEASYVKRINELLEPVLGRSNFRARVTADVDFTLSESTNETFKPNRDPNVAAVRSEQLSQSAASGAAGVQGIPGALSNQPPGPASAPISAQAGAGRAEAAGDGTVKNPGSTQRSSVVNYEVDKTVRHTRASVGSIRRLSTALVINHRKSAGADAKPAPIDEGEIAQIEALVREAVGFSKDRGDSLKVTSAAFSIEALEVAPDLPLWQRPEIIAYGIEVLKWLLGLMVILVALLGVLRPILRQLASPRVVTVPSTRIGETVGALEAPIGEEDSVVALSGPGGSASRQGAPDPSPMARIEAARALARDDPKLVANVVRSWVNANG